MLSIISTIIPSSIYLSLSVTRMQQLQITCMEIINKNVIYWSIFFAFSLYAFSMSATFNASSSCCVWIYPSVTVIYYSLLSPFAMIPGYKFCLFRNAIFSFKEANFSSIHREEDVTSLLCILFCQKYPVSIIELFVFSMGLFLLKNQPFLH